MTTTTRAAVLNVWNPSFEPRTIELHVEHLRARPGGWTWWGRIYGKPGQPSGGAASPELSRLLERAEAHCVREIERHGFAIMLVTDYVSLHALKVTELRGSKDRPAASELADYYEGRHALAWYRITDLRAISYDQLSTLAYLQTLVTFDRADLDSSGSKRMRLDPYASVGFRHPLPVELNVEDGHPFDAPGDAHRFVDEENAALPGPILRTLGKLQNELDELWPRLRRPAQLFLAFGEATRSIGDDASDFALRPAVQGLAAAIERELFDGVWTPLRYPAHSTPLAERWLQAATVVGFDEKKGLALGGLQRLVGGLARSAGHVEGLDVCLAVRRFVDEADPARLRSTTLGQLVTLRNAASHARSFRGEDFLKVRTATLSTVDSLLRAVLDARDEVAAVLSAERS